jgi:hypothetical protein
MAQAIVNYPAKEIVVEIELPESAVSKFLLPEFVH